MPSHTLKIVWLALSASGLVSCWIVLIAFSRVIQAYWGPMAYCVGATILQVSFCLGMIWNMDPRQMPHAFCIAQTALIGFSTFVLTGVCFTFSLASSLSVVRPSFTTRSGTLAWRPFYFIFIIIFPLLASVAQITVLVVLDAAQPSDDMHCDATSPEWVRFLGYAGTPFLVSIPSFILSSAAAYKIMKTHFVTQPRARSAAGQRGSLQNVLHAHGYGWGTPDRGRRSVLGGTPRAVSTPTPLALGPAAAESGDFRPVDTPPSSPTVGRAPLSPDLTKRSFHLPFRPSLLSDHTRTETPSETYVDERGVPSPVSSAFPTFAPPSNPASTPRASPAPSALLDVISGTRRPEVIHEDLMTESDGDVAGSLKFERDDLSSTHSASRTPVDHNFGWPSVKDVQEDQFTGGRIPSRQAERRMRRNTAMSQELRPDTPNLGPAIWRLILFQLAFFAIMCLAAISTIIDVATGRPTPTPFGTQHVALLLAAWGPFIVFSHLPGVRQQFVFWRHR